MPLAQLPPPHIVLAAQGTNRAVIMVVHELPGPVALLAIGIGIPARVVEAVLTHRDFPISWLCGQSTLYG